MIYDVNTPGDLWLIEQVVFGKQIKPCREYERTPKSISTMKGREIVHILCPPGCIGSKEDVEQKCGIQYAR